MCPLVRDIKDIQRSAPSAKIKCCESVSTENVLEKEKYFVVLKWNGCVLLLLWGMTRKCYSGSHNHPLCLLYFNCIGLRKRELLLLFSPDEFKTFLMRLPQNFFLNTSTIQHLWMLDGVFQRRYELLESSMKGLFRRAQRVVYKLFSLSKRCQKQPLINLPRERWAQKPSYLVIETMMSRPGLISEMG